MVLRDDVVVEAAPALRFMKRGRWSRRRVWGYCEAKGWQLVVIHA